MKLGPTLIGAVVGTVVGVSAQVLIESTLKQEAVWFALVIGLLTGLGTRFLAGEAMRTPSYARAGIVAIIAFSGILGATYASSVISRRISLEAYNSTPTLDIKAKQNLPKDSPAIDDEQNTAASESTASGSAADKPSEEETLQEESAEDTPSSETPPAETSVEQSAAEVSNGGTETQSTTSQVDRPANGSKVKVIEQMGSDGDVSVGELSVWQAVFVALGTFVAYELARGNATPD